MATFLQLCQQVHRYARIGQDAPGSAPVTVQQQEDVLAEIVGWVRDAWLDIQADQEAWAFMAKFGAAALAKGKREIDLDAAVPNYDYLRPFVQGRPHVLVAYADIGVDDQQPAWLVDWNSWAGSEYERGSAHTTTGKPAYCTVTPDGGLRVYPTPDRDVTLYFAYQRDAQTLSNDLDVPDMPERHHPAIVWRALMAYADTRDGTQEAYQKWERRRKQAMRRLYRDQLPRMTF